MHDDHNAGDFKREKESQRGNPSSKHRTDALHGISPNLQENILR